MASNIFELLEDYEKKWPDRILFVEKAKSFSARETMKRVNAYAYEFSRKIEQESGVSNHSVIAILIDHKATLVFSILACAMNGTIFTVINVSSSKAQIIHQLNDSGADFIVIDRDSERKLDNLGINSVPRIVVDEIDENYCAKFLTKHRRTPADIACYMYTSGSSGKAKGVIVPSKTLIDGARIVSAYLGVRDEDRILGILPLSFDYGLNQVLICLQAGATYYFHRYLLPRDLILNLARNDITGLALVPTLWPDLLVEIKRYGIEHLDSLRFITTAGGPHPISLRQEIAKTMKKVDIIIMYGLTESFRSSYLPPDDFLNKEDSIGIPVPEVELLILDEGGRILPDGEQGEIYHRGAFINYGYLNNSELTREKYVPDIRAKHSENPPMMVRSGDLGFAKNGYIYFTGRKDFQLKLSGIRISPSEIEEVFLAHAKIQLCAAVQNSVGSKLNVFLQVEENLSEDEVSFLKQQCKSQLPNYAQPEFIIQNQKLPRTSSGKIDYSSLRKQAKI